MHILQNVHPHMYVYCMQGTSNLCQNTRKHAHSNEIENKEEYLTNYNDMVEKTRDSYHASVELAKTQVFEISAVFVCLFGRIVLMFLEAPHV